MLLSIALFTCFVLSGLIISRSEKQLPTYLEICKRNDPRMVDCWKRGLNATIPHFSEGIPEFKIPPLDPFFIDHLQIRQRSTRSIRFLANLYNISTSGAKSVEPVNIEWDSKNLTLYLQLHFPHLLMNGWYKATGKVLLFQFDSNGKMEGDFRNVYSNGTYYLETYTRKGKGYLRIKRADQDIKVKKIYLYLHNLFKDNPDITASVNRAINDNMDILYEDFKPLLTETIGSTIIQYCNGAFGEFSYDVLFPLN